MALKSHVCIWKESRCLTERPAVLHAHSKSFWSQNCNIISFIMFYFYDVGGMAPSWTLVLFFGENDDKPCPIRFSSYQCRQRRPIPAVSMANVFYTISGR
ncbi:hypothetical protein TNCT_383611 [Trichonephila clavata]|uniref:Uncharacterized protein n=1 Tax=Trichonephila clavata TaxID=2740835 RepID=A0A8X6F858_TRICU|nr:hypothetical protein TNCT_383611 [Trichonephila clavata]